MLTHCNNFDTCIHNTICLDLDQIFDPNGNYLNVTYKNNKHITHIILFRSNNNLLRIGDGFLWNCTKLTTMDLSHLSNIASIGNDFLRNTKLTTIDLSPLSNVTSVGNHFLYDCSKLTTIDLYPLSNVTSVDNCFLSYCTNLTSIDLSPLSNVTSIGSHFLCDCRKLATIDLSPLSHIISVGNCFLSYCTKLTTINLAPLSNVTSIGDYFLSHTKFAKFDALNIKSIDTRFLSLCENLATLHVNNNQFPMRISRKLNRSDTNDEVDHIPMRKAFKKDMTYSNDEV